MQITKFNLSGNTFHGPATVAKNISHSQNTLLQSSVRDTKAEAIRHLIELVAKLQEKLEKDDAIVATRNLKMLVEEATSDKPQEKVMKVTSAGLIEAAKTVAAMSGPIITAVQGVLHLFGFN